MNPALAAHLGATDFIDIEHESVRAFTADAIGNASTDRDKAKRLFAAVRDQIWYDPYTVSDDPAHYRASFVLETGRAYCVPKAVLLTAVCRAAGIPAMLGFADVRNHLQTETLRALMGGTDLFVYHGYSHLYIDGRWMKATPAFNTELCARFGVPPVDFDGDHDALLHAFSADGAQHMEYVRDRGVFDDLPLNEILTELRNTYGPLMVKSPHVVADAFTEPPTSTEAR
jgi:transglutaminase-like putative cysteine protease